MVRLGLSPQERLSPLTKKMLTRRFVMDQILVVAGDLI
jgi:hypothetical protein